MNSISNKQFVFCPPVPGKPDPKQPDNPSARVAQSPQKGETCSFYALKILRNGKAIDPYPLEVQQKRRLAEKIFSTHRKMMTHLNETLNNRVDLAKQIAAACFNGVCTKNDAQKFLDQYSHVVHSEYKEFLQLAVQDFCSQDAYQDFVTFAESDYQQALIHAHEWCLNQLSIPEDFLKGSIPFQLGKSWQELSLEEKAGHEQNTIFNKHAALIGASRSPWHPIQPIDKLIKQLQLDGPLLIFGRFGQIYYEDDPFELNEKIENRPIFGWKPDAKKENEDNPINHAIVIVGAKTEQKKDDVYFIDPLDGSDPEDLSTQKIYVMPYDKLKASICNLNGIRMATKQQEAVYEPEAKDKNNYALYIGTH